MCSEEVNSFCSTSDTRRATIVTNPVIRHACGMGWIILTTKEKNVNITFSAHEAFLE
jgi:hypothetical protein